MLQNNDLLIGITEPIYFLTKSGCFCIASDIEQKIIPFFVSSSLYVVATDTESKTASTATPLSFFCSFKGIPSFLYVSSNLGSTSSKLFGLLEALWAQNNNISLDNLF